MVEEVQALVKEKQEEPKHPAVEIFTKYEMSGKTYMRLTPYGEELQSALGRAKSGTEWQTENMREDQIELLKEVDRLVRFSDELGISPLDTQTFAGKHGLDPDAFHTNLANLESRIDLFNPDGSRKED